MNIVSSFAMKKKRSPRFTIVEKSDMISEDVVVFSGRWRKHAAGLELVNALDVVAAGGQRERQTPFIAETVEDILQRRAPCLVDLNVDDIGGRSALTIRRVKLCCSCCRFDILHSGRHFVLESICLTDFLITVIVV